MRLMFVSEVHPDTPHISAVRLWRFARTLAQRGHEVVYVTCRGQKQIVEPEDSELESRLAKHEWRNPLLLELNTTIIERSAWRSGGILMRRMNTAWNLVVRGGPRWQWSSSVASNAAMIAATARPELIWTTFGHTSDLIAAQKLALAARCPWVMDVKDNWETFIPQGLRRTMVWRTRGWSAITANAEFTDLLARKWHRQESSIVYSGVDEAFLRTRTTILRQTQDLSLNLIGSLYDLDRLRDILTGIKAWVTSLSQPEGSRVRIRYLGADSDRFREVAADIIDEQNLELPGYVAIDELAGLCRLALANLYVRHEGGFHHKLLELLACGRPAIAYPGESEESWKLAGNTNGQLLEASSPAAVTESLARVYGELRGGRVLDSPLDAAGFPYTWSNLALGLEAVFESVQRMKK